MSPQQRGSIVWFSELLPLQKNCALNLYKVYFYCVYLFVGFCTKEEMIEHVVVAEFIFPEKLTQSAVEIHQQTIHFVGITFSDFFMNFRRADAQNSSQIIFRQIFDDSCDAVLRKVELGFLL